MISTLLRLVMDMQDIIERKDTDERKLGMIDYMLFTALERDLNELFDSMLSNHLTVSKMDDYKKKSIKSKGVIYHKNMHFVFSLN